MKGIHFTREGDGFVAVLSTSVGETKVRVDSPDNVALRQVAAHFRARAKGFLDRAAVIELALKEEKAR